MPKTIMTIDDSPTMRQMVSLTLSEAGYEIIEAVDGLDALAKINGHRIDLFLSDVNMPNLDGIELTRRLRANPGTRFTPIVLVTTESQVEKKMAGKAAGASGWIVKPFDPDQLLTVVKRVCP